MGNVGEGVVNCGEGSLHGGGKEDLFIGNVIGTLTFLSGVAAPSLSMDRGGESFERSVPGLHMVAGGFSLPRRRSALGCDVVHAFDLGGALVLAVTRLATLVTTIDPLQVGALFR